MLLQSIELYCIVCFGNSQWSTLAAIFLFIQRGRVKEECERTRNRCTVELLFCIDGRLDHCARFSVLSPYRASRLLAGTNDHPYMSTIYWSDWWNGSSELSTMTSTIPLLTIPKSGELQECAENEKLGVWRGLLDICCRMLSTFHSRLWHLSHLLFSTGKYTIVILTILFVIPLTCGITTYNWYNTKIILLLVNCSIMNF